MPRLPDDVSGERSSKRLNEWLHDRSVKLQAGRKLDEDWSELGTQSSDFA